MVEAESVGGLLADLIAPTLRAFSKAENIEVNDTIERLATDITLAVFGDNRKRMGQEFKEIISESITDLEVATSLAVQASVQITRNTLREGRKAVAKGDVFLALFDMGGFHMWPWTE